MNCLEFQRDLNIDPRRLPSAARAHVSTCPDCAQRLARQLAIETRIESSLVAEPPAGLEDRIMLAARLGQRQRQRFLALAATLVLGVTLVLGWPLVRPVDVPGDLALRAALHVLGEPGHLRETRAVEPEQLARLLSHVGARPRGALPVTYASFCPMGEGQGLHLVLQTARGRVTLLVDPHVTTERVLRRIGDGMVVEVRAAGAGSYSLVAPNEPAMDEAKAILASRVEWV